MRDAVIAEQIEAALHQPDMTLNLSQREENALDQVARRPWVLVSPHNQVLVQGVIRQILAHRQSTAQHIADAA